MRLIGSKRDGKNILFSQVAGRALAAEPRRQGSAIQNRQKGRICSPFSERLNNLAGRCPSLDRARLRWGFNQGATEVDVRPPAVQHSLVGDVRRAPRPPSRRRSPEVSWSARSPTPCASPRPSSSCGGEPPTRGRADASGHAGPGGPARTNGRPRTRPLLIEECLARPTWTRCVLEGFHRMQPEVGWDGQPAVVPFDLRWPFFYLVRAVNSCPAGRGPLGAGSDGSPRAGVACP